jgi:cytochrome c
MNKIRFLAWAVAAAIALASGGAFAGGDAAKGEKVFAKKCKLCHSAAAVDKGMGPPLAGIVGAKAGASDFKKYKGLKGSDIVWTEDNLDKFLANPKKFLEKKTSMAGKMKKADQRADVIAYIKTLQ